MHVAIGVPNYGEVRTEMMMSLIPAIFTLDRAGTFDYSLTCPAGCHNAKNRNKIVLDALRVGADYVFMVDTDMEFPSDTLLKLFKADKDIIGCTYNKRAMPLTPIHKIRREDMGNEIFMVNAVPTGVILIKTKVFLGMKPPWFAVEHMDLELLGPDLYFCKKSYDHGFEVWLDPTIDVKHIGTYKY